LPLITLYCQRTDLNTPFEIAFLPLVKVEIPFVSNGLHQYPAAIYLYSIKSKGSITPTNMYNKFLEQLFTLVRQRENPPEISSL
jgi:hypothetical protein